MHQQNLSQRQISGTLLRDCLCFQQGPAKGTISYWKRKAGTGGYGGLGHTGLFDGH